MRVLGALTVLGCCKISDTNEKPELSTNKRAFQHFFFTYWKGMHWGIDEGTH